MSNEKLLFFDITCKLDGPRRSWSPNTLKTRAALNLKRISYKESFISYPDIKPVLSALGVPGPDDAFTLPGICHPALGGDGQRQAMRDSLPIALFLERTYAGEAHPKLFPRGEESYALAMAVQALVNAAQRESMTSIIPRIRHILDDRGAEYFIRTRTKSFGKPLEEVEPTGPAAEAAWKKTSARLMDIVRALQPIPAPLAPGASAPAPSTRGPFFMGHTPSYADIIVLGFLGWFERGHEEWFKRMIKLGNGELGRLWEAGRELVDGHGEKIEWDVQSMKEIKAAL